MRVYDCIGLKCYILRVVQLKIEPGCTASVNGLTFLYVIRII